MSRIGEGGDYLFSNDWLKRLGGRTVELEFIDGRLATMFNYRSGDTDHFGGGRVCYNLSGRLSGCALFCFDTIKLNLA